MNRIKVKLKKKSRESRVLSKNFNWQLLENTISGELFAVL
jgi:hypothetical protein